MSDRELACGNIFDAARHACDCGRGENIRSSWEFSHLHAARPATQKVVCIDRGDLFCMSPTITESTPLSGITFYNGKTSLDVIIKDTHLHLESMTRKGGYETIWW